MHRKIFISPCNGDSAAGRITWLASQELVLEGKAVLCRSWKQIDDILADNGATPAFIIVDGCDRQCLFNQLLEEGLVGRHSLMLADIGIEALYLDDISRDDIELAKDAIIAACIPPKQTPPLPICGCGCR